MSSAYEVPLLTLEEKINIMNIFTVTHKNYSEKGTALREAMCLKIQFPAVMGAMKEEDLFAGRLGALPVGFSPQPECQQLGYYMDEFEMRKLFRQKLSEEQRDTLYKIRDYWRENNTNQKIKKLYDDELWEALPDKNYVYDRGPAYALYRISGTHLDFEKLLTYGVCGLKDLLNEKSKEADEDGRDLYTAMKLALEVYSDTCRYYENMVESMCENASGDRREHLIKLKAALGNISSKPAGSFLEAIQMTLLYWLISGSFNFGRMDTYLAKYYVKDVDSGDLSEEEALKLLIGMWRIMIARNKPYDTRVVIGGEGRTNVKDGDRFSLLAMKASMETMDVTPQLTLRFSKNTPKEIMDMAYEAIGKGTTFPMLYCDEVNIPAVAKAFGLKDKEAEQYCPFGCGEYVIFHKSIGTPSGLINLLKVLEITLNNGYDQLTGEPLGLHLGGLRHFEAFEDLWNAYSAQVEYFTEQLARQEELEYQGAAKDCAFLFFSILFDNCIDRGKALLDGGIWHLGGTLESYGNINTADSLTAIKKLVYEEKRITPKALMDALRSDFEGYEELRRQLIAAPKFGNDDEEADKMAARVHEQICQAAIDAGRKTQLDSYLIVIINNNANTVLGKLTSASPDGRRGQTFMANANCPYKGNDKKGITAMLNSLTKLKTDLHAGGVQNLKFSKEMFRDKLPLTKAMLETYFQKGGSQAMISVIGREDLQKALLEPEKYKNLLVRVGGFSARFVELGAQEQQEILARTLY
jgi:pyruvate-formate lyase